MKFQLEVLLLFLVLLSACAPQTTPISPSAPPILQSTVSSSVISQPTNEIQLTRTPQPTRTPNPTNTPRPVWSATPTFDISSIVTSTQAPAEQCPKLADIALPNFSRNQDNFSSTFAHHEQDVLSYLNKGGIPSNLIASLRRSWRRQEVFATNETVRDLTGDGVPEILIIPSELFIFGCRESQYQTLMFRFSEAALFNSTAQQLVGIQDMNLNGIPEVVIAEFGCGGFSAAQCLVVYVYEWDGTRFISLTSNTGPGDDGVYMTGGRLAEYLPDVKIQDIDNNGTLELILTGNIINPWYQEHFINYPWRDKSDIYKWNGRNFVFFRTEFSSPMYQYQAVQDGDRALLNSEYTKALTLYQEAIFNENLLGWSPAHRERFTVLHQYAWDSAYRSTPTPEVPPDDPLEYPHLAAYARFRIMLIHILLGNMTEAEIVYDTLQERFPDGSHGHEFALVAKAFWDEYQINSSIASACKRAIAYAKTKSEILNYLGGKHHNLLQDKTYQSEDVCPFQ